MVRSDSPSQKMIKGAMAGLLATFPMTVFMRTAWRGLAEDEKYPLPPRQITRRLVKEADSDRYIESSSMTRLTLLLHFIFGGTAGSFYGMVEDKIPLNENTKGSLMGLAVWSGSYLGLIPALGILSPATDHPWRRNLLMIVAHLIWGVALGILTRRMRFHRSYIDLE